MEILPQTSLLPRVAWHLMVSILKPLWDGIWWTLGWDVVDIKNNAKNLMGRITGINFISGDADKNNAGPEKEERKGGGYWKSSDHSRAVELEIGELDTTDTVDGKTAVAPIGKLATKWSKLKNNSK